MYLLGFDIGSSSVKASLVVAENGRCIASAFSPEQEMTIISSEPGWAEQHPEIWWYNLKTTVSQILTISKVKPIDIKAIGISYQMHGLVCVDKDYRVIRPSIIWCDSRAVHIGEKAFNDIGRENCLNLLLNSPGNFTASKLRWIRENEPALFNRIHKFMLPGDYIALQLTGECYTTVPGISEGILWDFRNHQLAEFLLNYFEINPEFIPTVKGTFSEQGRLTLSVAKELGLHPGIPVTYRAGDQPNNALSLNVLKPGDVAATAGTSGVVYGVSDEIMFDAQSRINTFAHVNHKKDQTRLGVLLCINGTGILNSWIKKNVATESSNYNDMNQLASEIPVSSEGLLMLPFGNGAERMLGNKETGATFFNMNFNIHTQSHIYRAAQEGIAFAFHYGIEIMKQMGMQIKVIRAGNQNMFLSPVFRQALADITGVNIEIIDTDGATGAAKGAGIGAGIYSTFDQAFSSLKRKYLIETIERNRMIYIEVYEKWKNLLNKML